MGMYLFALVMIVLNLAAFGPGAFTLAQTSERGGAYGITATVEMATRR